MSGNSGEQMLDVFIFETEQNVGQLEAIVLESEKSGRYSEDAVNEVFRIMHTIKGSAAMMMFGNLSSLAHGMEDLFFYLREYEPKKVDYSVLSDLVLAGVDFIKAELQKIKSSAGADGDVSQLTGSIEEFLKYLQAENGMIAEGGKRLTGFQKLPCGKMKSGRKGVLPMRRFFILMTAVRWRMSGLLALSASSGDLWMTCTITPAISWKMTTVSKSSASRALPSVFPQVNLCGR